MESIQAPHWSRTISSLFLIAGTCIGGGMLGLPISSGSVGFLPSVLAMLACCIFMTVTGLLYLEATLWMKEETHVISLSSRLLGKPGAWVSWAIYLFICYASLVAYVSGGGKEFSFVSQEIFSFPLSKTWGYLLFTLIFGVILYKGHKFVERVNALLFLSMIAAYVLLIFVGHGKTNPTFLLHRQWDAPKLFFVIPLMLTTFSFPGIVPTIVPYLHRDPRALRIAIIGGTTLTFFVYLSWLYLVMGTVPMEGSYGLKQAFLTDISATECMHYALNNPWISLLAQFFAFFALATSFLGMSLGLFDFLADGLKIQKTGSGKWLLGALILIPSYVFALLFYRAFIAALEMSGGIGDAIFSGALPALMIWQGRYKQKLVGPYKMPGGKILLIFVALFSGLVFVCEITRRIPSFSMF